jgi:hypothetical protein
MRSTIMSDSLKAQLKLMTKKAKIIELKQLQKERKPIIPDSKNKSSVSVVINELPIEIHESDSSEEADRVIALDKTESEFIKKDGDKNVYLKSPTFGDTIVIKSP